MISCKIIVFSETHYFPYENFFVRTQTQFRPKFKKIRRVVSLHSLRAVRSAVFCKMILTDITSLSNSSSVIKKHCRVFPNSPIEKISSIEI